MQVLPTNIPSPSLHVAHEVALAIDSWLDTAVLRVLGSSKTPTCGYPERHPHPAIYIKVTHHGIPPSVAGVYLVLVAPLHSPWNSLGYCSVLTHQHDVIPNRCKSLVGAVWVSRLPLRRARMS